MPRSSTSCAPLQPAAATMRAIAASDATLMAANAIMIPFAPSLTIVIPAYNERENLPRVVADALAFARTSCRVCEVLVVDDGSTDGSDDVLRALAAPALRVVRHEKNAGLSAALRTGFYAAAND